VPKLTVSPSIDGTWVRLTTPDGTTSDFNSPLDLWHAIVSQPGFFTPEQLGLLPTEPLRADRVRPERLRAQAVATRCALNAKSLRRFGIGTSGLPQPTQSAVAKPKALRVPKWASDKRETLDLDPDTASI
jgi:hypothetical protein